MAYKRKPYRYKLRVKIIFWSFVLMIVFSIALIFMNKPTTGTIIKPSLGDDPLPTETAKTNTITAKYFSLTYDAGLDTVSDISSGDKTALEVYRVARSDTTGRRTFVVTIKQLPQGGMTEESSYKIRHINPGTYRESNETFRNNPMVLMEKLDGSELTGFAVKNGRLAMLSYTLATPGADLGMEARGLLGSFHWLD